MDGAYLMSLTPARVHGLTRHALRAALLVVVLGAVTLLCACQLPGSAAEPNPAEEGANDAQTPGDQPAGEVSADAPPATVGSTAARRSVAVEPRNLYVVEGSSEAYQVVLGSRPSGAVTVTVAAPANLTVAPDALTFTEADWETPRTVTVSAARDADAVAEPPVEVSHAVAGGGYDEVVGEAVRVIVVEVDAATLTGRDAMAAEPTGVAGFVVMLSRVGSAAVTVNYATGAGGDSATGSVDYVSVDGTLSFAAGSTAARTIEVAVLDDALDEPDEHFTLTLSGASVPLAGGAATLALTGEIGDDEAPPRLSIADSSVTEGGGSMLFTVSLDPASGQAVTVEFATADATATADADYAGASGALTFDPGSTAETIAVQVVDDETVEETETFVVALSGEQRATVSGDRATGTILDNDVAALELASLQVIGGGEVYPAFDSGTYHYALSCAAGATLQISAVAAHASQRVTLLRADPDSAVTASGSINAAVQVNQGGGRIDQDIAVEVTDANESVTYVVHCLPPDFPDIAVVTRQQDVSDTLLFLVTGYRDEHGEKVRYEMILDNNGVPRFHRSKPKSWDFRPVTPAGTYRGHEVHYQNVRALYSADFRLIGEVKPWDGVDANNHDFLVAPNGRFIGLYRYETRRDLSGFTDKNGTPLGDNELVLDGRIREFERGVSVQYWKFDWLAWNSRATVKLSDCRIGTGRTLTHINSIQLVDGDIVASIRNCSQVVRIDRDGGTGAVEWKLGGTDPGAASEAEYLEIVDDPAGEFCGQHTATLTDRDTVLLFDNGLPCIGRRKEETRFTRAVEYDIASGTQAVFLHEYRPPAEQGYSNAMGSVFELDNGHWLISWGTRKDVAVELAKRVAISVVNPADGRVLLELDMSKHGEVLQSYRASGASAPSTAIPLKLP